MRRLFCPPLALLLGLSLPTGAFSQMGRKPVNLTGVVLIEGRNQPIQHALVRLSDSGANVLGQTTTSDSGEFAFRGLQRSSYVLRVEADGFRSAEIDLDLTFTSDKGVTVYLKPAGKPLSAPSAGNTISAHELSMPEAARELVASAKKKLYVDKDPQAAMKGFQQAVAVAPGYYEAFCEIGAAFLTMGDKTEAEANFRKSIEQSQDTYAEARLDLGILLIGKGEIDAGESAIRRGLVLNPSSWLGFYELGKLDLSRNRLEFALQSAERAKALAPNTPIVYRLLTNIHMRQANCAAAVNDIDAYLKLDPNSAAGIRAAEIRKEILQEMSPQSQSLSGNSHSTMDRCKNGFPE